MELIAQLFLTHEFETNDAYKPPLRVSAVFFLCCILTLILFKTPGPMRTRLEQKILKLREVKKLSFITWMGKVKNYLFNREELEEMDQLLFGASPSNTNQGGASLPAPSSASEPNANVAAAALALSAALDPTRTAAGTTTTTGAPKQPALLPGSPKPNAPTATPPRVHQGSPQLQASPATPKAVTPRAVTTASSQQGTPRSSPRLQTPPASPLKVPLAAWSVSAQKRSRKKNSNASGGSNRQSLGNSNTEESSAVEKQVVDLDFGDEIGDQDNQDNQEKQEESMDQGTPGASSQQQLDRSGDLFSNEEEQAVPRIHFAESGTANKAQVLPLKNLAEAEHDVVVLSCVTKTWSMEFWSTLAQNVLLSKLIVIIRIFSNI